MVNQINGNNSEEEEVTAEEVTREDKNEEDGEADVEEKPGGTFDITDFEDLMTYKDIPNFANFPTWLRNLIKEFKSIFTNQISEQSIMNVEPVTFTLRDDVEIPNNNLTAHLPPANLRESADKLLDKLERGGLQGYANTNQKPFSELLDQEDLKDDNDKGVIRIIDT